MRKTKKFVINAVILTATSLILRSLGLSFSVYLSKTVGAEAMGTFHLILSVYFFAITVSTSGIGLTMTKLISEEIALGREHCVGTLLKKGILYCLGFSVIGIGLLLAFSPVLVTACFDGAITRTPFLILAVGLPFVSVSAALSGYFTARRKVYKTAAGQIAEQLLKMGITVGILLLFKPQTLTRTMCTLIVGGTVGEVFSCFYLFLCYRFEKKIVERHFVKRGQWKRLFGFALPIALSSYLRSGLSGVKQLSVPARLRKSGVQNAVEQYGIINAMVFPVLMFPQVVLSAFSSLIVPEITEKYTLRQGQALNRILTRIFKITLVFAVATGGILFLYAKDLCFLIYGNTDIAFYLKLLAPLTVIMYLDDIVDAVLKGINCQVSVVRINILDSLVSIFLLWYLLPLYHIKGYFMVIFIGEILNGTLSILKLIQKTDFSISFFKWIFLPAVMIWISMLASKILLPFSMWGSILLSVCLYVGMLYAAGIIDYRDFKL
ncbi:MAG: oligosaccharide flippase family protein [Clostridia bacterium]|nr:oligosaccharide flippase family protein [Clostridia bacterium]